MKYKKIFAFLTLALVFFSWGFVWAQTESKNSSSTISEKQTNKTKILHYRVEGAIHSGTGEMVKSLFKKAKEVKADFVFLELDTPGGTFGATEVIVKEMLNSNDLPVIVHVAPKGAKAGSAGTFITMAAHVAVMAPGTYIGAAHPVMVSPSGQPADDKENSQQKILNEKIESASTSFIQSIANQRNRNEKWAIDAVLKSDSITAKEALKKNVIDYVAETKSEILSLMAKKAPQNLKDLQLDPTQVEWVEFEPSFQNLFFNFLANPTLLYLLGLIMVAGAYLEVNNPGTFIYGGIAAVCLILILIANQVIPVNFFGVFLILASIGLFYAEIYVPSFGLLTVLGLVSFVMGSLFFFDQDKSDISVPLPLIISATFALLLIVLSVGFAVVKGMRRRQSVGKDLLIGSQFKVEDWNPQKQKGRTFLNSEYWNFESNDSIKPGDQVQIKQLKGLTLVVGKVGEE